MTVDIDKAVTEKIPEVKYKRKKRAAQCAALFCQTLNLLSLFITAHF
jgi:hypothetical protein